MTEEPVATRQEMAFALLRELFAEIDGNIAAKGLACVMCGKCCRFSETEHVLFATALEIDYLFQFTGPRFPDANRCPYQEGTLCTARSGRTLGCRLHFCRVDVKASKWLTEFSSQCHARLRAIHEEADIAYNYAPFFDHLANSGGLPICGEPY